MIIGLDPGTTQTGCVLLDGYKPIYADVMPNANVIPWLQTFGRATELACEWVQSYGMPVGAEVFDTVRWIGRFQQAWHTPDKVQFITRKNTAHQEPQKLLKPFKISLAPLKKKVKI